MGSLKSKKAVSPLIATVLLIAFAVALGAVVMNWGRSYVESEPGEITGAAHVDSSASPITDACSGNILLDIVRIGGKPSICYDGTVIKYTIENKGSITMDAVKFQVIGLNDIFNSQISTMPSADIKKSSIGYDQGKYGSIEQIRFIPTVGGTVCPKKALTIENIGKC